MPEPDPFTRLAAVLATMPDLAAQLLTDHPPTGTCTGCRPPGSVTPVPAPCPIRRLALLAAQHGADQD